MMVSLSLTHPSAQFLMDVLTYILVLNLAAELVDNIKMEHFSISIFVAVVLKLIMNAIQYLEHEIQHFFCVRLERKIMGAFFMWLVVFSSKFLFLWLDDVIFGENVELGYIWEILILSAVLIITEKLNRILFYKLGDVYRVRHPDDGGDEGKEEVRSTSNAEDVRETIDDQGAKQNEKEP